MAAEVEWVLSEDGCLCVNGSVCNIHYHPNLNVIFVISKDSSVKVLDACSGTVLQTSNLSATSKSQVQCKYIPGHDKVLFTDGKAIGLRRDHNGVLLLDTILQTRVEAPNEVVKMELLLTEATQLWRCLKELDVLGGDITSEVQTELEKKIKLSEAQAKINHKVEKWCTVCLELPLGTLKSVFSGLVQELKRLNRCVPSLSIASAVTERLNSLLPPATTESSQSGVTTVDRSLMFSEFARRETFGKWPHMNYKWAQPEQMAQAGFYHQSNSTGDDRAMCFTCNICLVCWEPTDEPWSEHERHSPTCPYVKGEYTQNVPLSITYATSPALLHTERQERISCISTSNFPDLIATATENGSVVVWNVSQSLKKEFNFLINPKDPYILSTILTRQKRCRASLEKEGWTVFCGAKCEGDVKTKYSLGSSHQDDNDLEKLCFNRGKDDVRVMALSVFGSWQTTRTDVTKSSDLFIDMKPSVVIGASIDATSTLMSRPGSCKEENLLVQVLNDANQISCSSQSLDIMKMEGSKNDAEEEEVQTNGSSKGGSNTRSVTISPGLYLLHYSLGKRQSRRTTLSGNVAASSSGSSSKVTSGIQRDANRLFYQSLGVLLDDALECPYDLNPYATPPPLVQTNDLKFNVYSMENVVEDMCDSVSGTESGYALLESESDDVENQARSMKTDGNEEFACSRVIECLELPGNFSGDTHFISHIVPTLDNRHALVVIGLGSSVGQNCTFDTKPVGAIFLYQLESSEDGVILVKSPVLQRTLVRPDDMIVDVVVLPKEVGEVKEDVLNGVRLQTREELPSTSSQEGPRGYVAVVTRGGCLQVITLSTLEVVGELKPCSTSPYVAAVYCGSIERLCVCTSDGTLRLLQLRSKARDMGVTASSRVRLLDFLESSQISDSHDSGLTATKEKMESDGSEQFSFVHLPLTLPVLNHLHQFTEFVNLTPRFTATLPACWMEIQQEQKQRRHPQHLQQQGMPNQHTRSWRLQSDGSSWDEHLFEISLPRSCCIGHIDFKFSLQPSFASLPNIQATLLKQNTGGIGKRDSVDEDCVKPPSETSKSKHCVDQDNPVFRREFLEAHNAEILCGPISLASCLDLSCQSGIVTFTSPKLMETKSRTFIIHLKALRNGSDKLQLRQQLQHNKKRETLTTGWTQATKPPLLVQNLMKMQDKHGPVPSLQSLLEYYFPSGNTIDLLADSTPSWKTETVRGCDLLHEISITVRMAKKLNVAHERHHRLAMLTSTAFHERLLNALCSKESLSDDMTLEHQQHLILDILNWIASIQSNEADDGCLEDSCIFIKIQSHLQSIIRCCYLDTSRSIAHKCSKLIILCLEYMKDYKGSNFKNDLARALLDVLPSVVSCRTAGAMQWFFLLLDRVKFYDGGSVVGNRCLAMLIAVVRELDTRADPYHALLRTRFGLGRNPFEPDLFEIEAPLPPEPTSTPVTYAAVVGNGGGSGGGGGGSIGVGTSSGVNNNNNSSSSNGFFAAGGVASSSGVGASATSGFIGRCSATSLCDDGRSAFSAFSPSTHHLRGLLEVEPLHFMCHAASDGTKVEKLESGSSSGTGNPLALSPNATIYVPSSSGTRKTPNSQHDPKKSEVFIKWPNVKMNANSVSSGGSLSSGPTSSLFSSSSSSSSSASFKNDRDYGIPVDVGSITSVPISPWLHFLQPPPQQALVIERMHSGARRFVVLDFGKSILLTDMIIPACPDLVSLSVDIWTEGEEIDGQRLVVSTDIWCLSLVMNDLLPPPTCRFLKITVIGRYGMSPTRCRIPLGTFYGHTVVPPWLHVHNSENSEEPITKLQTHLNVLSLLLEDINCRYSLSCDKLRVLLGPLLAMERPASAHIQAFIRRERGKTDVDEQRIFAVYRDCIQLQQQLNLTVSTAERLRRTMVPIQGSVLKPSSSQADRNADNLNDICTDKLLVLGECLLVALLGITYNSSSLTVPSAASSSFHSPTASVKLDHATCELLFRHSAIVGSSRFQVLVNTLMVRSCGLEPWWGSFIAKMIVELYHSNQTAVFPQDRVFLLLVSCHDKAFLNNTVPSIFELLQELLAPIMEADGILEGVVDVSLAGWVLLFISFYMDIAENGSHIANGEDTDEGAKTIGPGIRRRNSTSRWDFVQEEWAMLRNRSNRTKLASHRLCRRKLQKRLMYHKQQLEDLEQVKKSCLPNNAYSNLKNHFGSKMAMDLDAAVKKVIKQHTAKHFKDIVLIRRSEGADLSHLDGGEQSTSHDINRSSKDYNEMSNVCVPSFCLPRSQALRVAHGLATLLLTMDYSCNVDVFLLTCKVLGKLATLARPAIGLGEIIDQSHLEKLLLRCVRAQGMSIGSHGWGGPWATHAITCLLQDILEGEKLYPILKRSPQERTSVANDLVIDSLGSPDTASSSMADLPPWFTSILSDADKNAVSFGSNGNLAGLMKTLDADSDETSSDGAVAENVDTFPNFEKLPIKNSWASSDGSSSLASSLPGKDDPVSDDSSLEAVSFPVVSTAIDARLELGIDGKAELRLKAMILSETKVLFDAFFGPLTPPNDVCASQRAPSSSEVPVDPVFPLSFSSQVASSSVDMLAICFDRLFSVHGLDLESLLHLWVTLNEATSDVVGRVLPLSMGVASGILASLVWHPTLSLRTWYLAFQTLQLQPWRRGEGPDAGSRNSSLEGGGVTDMSDPMSSMLCKLLPVLLKFLSGSGLENSFLCKSNVGPSVTSAMCAFLKRLFLVCENPPVNVRTVIHLKEQLLRTVYLLVNSSGPVQDGQGPLDAQYCLVNFLQTINFTGTDRYLRTSVVEAVSSLVHVLIQSSQRVTARSSTESEASDATCFGGILSVLPRADSSGTTVEVTQSTLVHALLSLCVQLVKSSGSSDVSLHHSSPLDRHHSQRLPPITSMTDTLKMEQKTTETPTTSHSSLAHGSVLETDELKSAATSGNIPPSCTHSHALSPSPKQEYIADEVLKHQPSMMWMLQSLSACTGSPIAMLLGPMGVGVSAPGCDGADGFFLGEPVSVGDVVFKLLCTLNAYASNTELILQPILTFLTSGGCEITGIGLSAGPCMSEPLLWLIIRILDCEHTISEFIALGGIQVICRNLVSSHRQQVNGQPSLLSIVLQKVNRIMAPGAKDNNWPEWDGVDGLVNFAPLGVITLKDPTIQPADVLIQPTPPHRRARTPAWSYHFYPEEAWVDLTITLPCAILLREVHIQPHLTSLATCPSAVALEISRDGAFRPRPLGLPRPTAGLTFIRLQLAQPEVATSVVVRLYKPRDSSNIGLSQIILLGTSAFGDASNSSGNERVPSVPTEEGVAKSSVGWLRLLHHCLVLPSNRDIQKKLCTDAAAVPGLLGTCCSLLLTPVPESYATHVESVLLYLGRSNPRVGLQIVETLLATCSSPFGQGAWSHAIGLTQSSVMMMDSVMDVVFSLCTTLDAGTADRIRVLLNWLSLSAQKALKRNRENDRNNTTAAEGLHGIPEQMFICCTSAILWNLHESGFCDELTELLDIDLLRLLYEWVALLPPNSSMRRSVHSVFSSYCYIRPDYFKSLLQWMGFLPECRPMREFDLDEDYEAPITDDSKESGGYQTKDLDSVSKSDFGFLHTGSLQLNVNCLSTLASASQSPPAINKLIESGLPQVLAQDILDFCLCERSEYTKQVPPHPKSHHEGQVMTDADKASQHRHTRDVSVLLPEMVTAILDFFTTLCMESTMRDWLGGPEGSIFWLPLLEFLCLPLSRLLSPSFAPQTVTLAKLSTRQRSSLEAATVRFLSHCCWCHPDNQQLLSQVLCEVIGKQASFHRGGFGILRSITGFSRQLILQLLLENEKILVYVKSYIGSCGGQSTHHRLPPYGLSRHPRFGSGHHFRLLYLATRTTCSEIAQIVTSEAGALTLTPPSSESNERQDRPLRDLGSMGLELADCLSVAAGVLAKDKRHKEPKNSSSIPAKSASGVNTKTWTKASSVVSGPLVQSSLELTHDLLPDQPLPGKLTLRQLLTLLKDRGHSLGCPYVTLALQHSGKHRGDTSSLRLSDELLLEYDTFPSALQVFASVGGLALLAPYLPVLYPDSGKQQVPASKNANEKAIGDFGTAADGDWVKVDAPDDIFDDFPELLHPGTSTSRPSRNTQLSFSVPPHSLAAFGLFLRLPGYAETLLKERQKAQCLLRLALGVTDDGEGGDIFTSPVSHTLPTLPFKVLQQLFDATPLTTDDGVLLRRMALDVGAVHLLLSCLSILSHQDVDLPMTGIQPEFILPVARINSWSQDSQQAKSDDKSHLYWAKGTGFGTGSTTQSWDVEQAISKQKSEEEHVTCLLQVLASYINPRGNIPYDLLMASEENHIWLEEDSEGDEIQEESNSGETNSGTDDVPQALLPSVFPELLAQSCVFATISSYLRNDSVLDMARHVPLYRALLQLLRAMAVSGQLVGLLLPPIEKQNGNNSSGLSICCLLTKMKSCVDTYDSRLRSNKANGLRTSTKLTSGGIGKSKEEEESEGLAMLIPDVQETARIVDTATARLLADSRENGSEKLDRVQESTEPPVMDRPIQKTIEERYLEVMKRLQFDTFEMIVEDDDGVRFTVPHHFESNMRAAGDHGHPSRARRLAQEAVTISTSLPLSYSSSVFVRCDQDRLDLMKVLITGPADTPYANGCFEFDVYFPPDYPNSPMLINLETTGHHTVRFNPNLYNDGKVCLSILNTWHGRPEEKWNPQTSSFLQVLVSIQSLILVQEPYFNEPGYERSRGTPSGQQSSREYDSNIRQATVKWGMLEQLRNVGSCFKEVIHRHFWMKRIEIMNQCQRWIHEMETQGSDRRTGRTVVVNCQALKRHFAQLMEELSRISPPPGLEDIECVDWHESSGSIASTSQNEYSPSATSKNEVTPQVSNDKLVETAVADMSGSAAATGESTPSDSENLPSSSSSHHSRTTSFVCGPV